MADSASEALWVVGELMLPTPVVLLALRLENRGFLIYRIGDILRVSDPKSVDGKPDLTEQDISDITCAKFHLLQLVDYCTSDHKKAQQPQRNRSAQRNRSQQRNTAVENPIESGVNSAQQRAQQ